MNAHRDPIHAGDGWPAGPPRAGRLRRAAVRFPLLLALVLAVPAAFAPRVFAQSALSPISADVDQVARRARPSLVTVIAQRDMPPSPGMPSRRSHSRVGSGVAVDQNDVLTTASVVLGANRVVIVTDNGLQAEAELVGMDPIFNVALLRVPNVQLPAVSFAARTPQLGDWVIALGSSYRYSPTQSVGNVAFRFREPRLSLLQLTNEVYPGNSGGAALNTRGELVGLVQGELGSPEPPGRNADSERRPGGLSFAIPVEDVLRVYESLKREGRVRHGYLGVSTRAAFVDSDTQPGLRVPIGAIVEAVQPGGPADRVGLKKGDLIVAFDGERVEYQEQLARWVAAAPPGSVVRLVWAHDEMQRQGSIALGESPSVIPEWMQTAPTTVPAATPAPNGQRIAELQEQIRKLNQELGRLRNPRDSTH